MVLKVRETLVCQRTQLVNALRGHAAEFGVIAATGIRQIPPLLEAIAAETAIPSDAREMLALFGQEIDHLDSENQGDRGGNFIAMHKANPISRLLATIPGIGPILALTLGNRGRSGSVQIRHVIWRPGSDWRQRNIRPVASNAWAASSRAGNERLRQLLVAGPPP